MARRALERHVQQELPKTRTRDKHGQFRGGARRGAGRPKRPLAEGRASEPHQVRPAVSVSHPVHVVMRAHPGVGSLRTLEAFAAVREARMVAMRLDDSFRIVHFSIQRTHLHLIVEAVDREALWTGMRVFSISCAKQLNAAVSARRGYRRRGTVFTDRYHARNLKTPREVRHCLSYVLRGSTAIAHAALSQPVDVRAQLRDDSCRWRFSVWRPRTRLLRDAWPRWSTETSERCPRLRLLDVGLERA